MIGGGPAGWGVAPRSPGRLSPLSRRMRSGPVVAATASAVLVALLGGCSGSNRSPAGDGHRSGQSSGGAAAAAPGAADAQLQPCPAPGHTASGSGGVPDLTLACLGGGPDVALTRVTGMPTVVNLWASWCLPCREETPAIARFASAAAGKVRVLGVASGDSSKRTSLSFDAAAGVHYPSLWDPQMKLREHLGVPGLPVTLLVTAAGKVVWTHAGDVTEQSLAQAVAAHLGVAVHD